MNRRDFLQRLEAASAAALCGGLTGSLSGCLGFYYVNATVSGNRVLVQQAELGDDRFALVEAPGFQLPIFLYRVDDGTYSAVSTRCMHRGCQVEPAADRLICPCHGSEYTNTGEVLKGPTQRPLRRLPTRVEGDQVVIELPAGGDQW